MYFSAAPTQQQHHTFTLLLPLHVCPTYRYILGQHFVPLHTLPTAQLKASTFCVEKCIKRNEDGPAGLLDFL